jgi:DNA recombination protein Rad52
MALNDTQIRLLKAKLDPAHIRTRNSNGANLSYIEGWHAIAEANRIFGYDAWDRRTIATTCVWTAMKGGNHLAAYTAKVRVTVRAGDVVVVREGSGTGEAISPTPGQAHELALKGAETDATKRALATFGNPFGLALYDREQAGVRKTRGAPSSLAEKSHSGPWVLRSATALSISSHDNPKLFVDALRQVMSEARDIELLYDVWEQNIDTLRAVHRSWSGKASIIPEMVAHLRACAVALVKAASNGSGSHRSEQSHSEDRGVRQKIDKSVLTISEPKRIRCKEHLRFVATQPCLICGRSPSHAHHVRYAQPRGLSLKVSDEFTIPLCAIHHHHIHTTGKEREWWQERKIDPLKVAADLWQRSREHHPGALKADLSKSLELEVKGASTNDLSPDAAAASGREPIANPERN